MKFEIKEEFYLDGKEIKIISGAVHYFRSTPNRWIDILTKLKQIGCNTVETYVPWFLHEPREGEYDFSGNLDISEFLQIANDLGLYAIVRVGPYICAEVEFGGLPWWLMCKNNIRVRTDNDVYLNLVDNYFNKLFAEIKPHLITNGGNVLFGQLENEYGSYANDKEYLRKLHDITVKNGFNASIVTSDGAWGNMLDGGTMYHELGILPTVNFGSEASTHFNTLQKFVGEKKIPYMCMEFWCGWFTSWGHEKINRTNVKDVGTELEDTLNLGSVNFYMFHGGTNFGNISGANKTRDGGYSPHITSYDYDAILDERGNPTEKYYLCRDVIAKYTKHNIEDIKICPSDSYEAIEYCGAANLINRDIFETEECSTPLSIEALGYGYGYVHYEIDLKYLKQINTLEILGLTDRAYLYINDELVKVLEGETDYHLELNKSIDINSKLSILLDCNPRVNYGMYVERARKGLLDGVFINDHFFAMDYFHTKIENDYKKLSKLSFGHENINGPYVSKYKFDVKECFDTYLDCSKLGKGFAYVNGNNLGRYWNRGPQTHLFVPNEFLKVGTNEILILDTEGKSTDIKMVCEEESRKYEN